MFQFELVSKYPKGHIPLPQKGTDEAAGFDMVAAEDTLIPSYSAACFNYFFDSVHLNVPCEGGDTVTPKAKYISPCEGRSALTLNEAKSEMNEQWKDFKPTLIPLGVKCKLDKGTHLELYSRSSSPLNYLLIEANSVGIIDSDYYDNAGNEGEIFFQVINLSPVPIMVQKGERICQGIVKDHFTVETSGKSRMGGFGSTGASTNI